jgi:two-component system, NtrC family, sensor kinase
LDLYNKIGYNKGVEYLYLTIIQNLISLNQIHKIPGAYWDRLDAIPNGQSNWFDGCLMRAKAEILKIHNKPQQAIPILLESLKNETDRTNSRGASNSAIEIALNNKELGNLDSAIEYALLAYSLASETFFLQRQITATELLSQCYEESDKKDKAFEYLKLNRSLNEKSERLNNAAQISELEIQAVLKKSQREIDLLEKESHLKEQENKTQRLWIFSIAGALLSAILIAFILVRNNRQKQKANTVLEDMLSNLKSTQSQLIQSEKMASLGELTAGIAHEIQNPLNFVNNFSEVNKELLMEMTEEIGKGNLVDVKTLAKHVIENEEKINQHGKRADAIVKGMLQHSRTSTGQKEPTNINALCDEYLRLSYHGLRAKDKSFNARIETNFDSSIENINVVPQDIGRVVLNLINNAFYAVAEKSKKHIAGFDPTVSIITKKVGNAIEIMVKDNGIGIPQNIIDKIFQPFFTNKPTGQGTGLGLSLSYDIVKAHGGDLKVQTKEGGGSEFIIQLPIS